ncbi:MAG: sulfotransferase family 2 domain-containing protein [Saprospiraceae bacterium]|nr:sulfotransferase family 2 domain-containing protein [Saprospiraceae bacterium]
MAAAKTYRRPLERNIDTERKFLFVHIPKTAGTSIKKALGLTPEASHGKYFHFRERLGPRAYRKYYKIAFVRNPWDRFLSFYLYARMDENFYHSTRNPDKALYGKNRHYDLLKHASLNDCAHYLIEGRFKPLSGTFYFMAPQCEWIMDEQDTLQIDFLGKYESLEADVSQVCDHLGMPDAHLEVINNSRRERADFRQYYDAETRALIAKYYERDIELLKYTFT